MTQAPDWLAAPKLREEPPPIEERISLRLDARRAGFRRRLSDQIEGVFQEACMVGDLAVAEDLLHTLERMRDRWAATTPRDRRQPPIPIEALREMLEHYRTEHESQTL